MTVTSLDFGKAIVNDKPAQLTSTFSATDQDIYAFIGLNATKGNPEIKFVWTLVNGIDPTTKRPVTNIQIAEYGKNASSTRMYGSITRTGTSPGPTGTYRLDVYVNGVVKKSGTFTVTVTVAAVFTLPLPASVLLPTNTPLVLASVPLTVSCPPLMVVAPV